MKNLLAYVVAVTVLVISYDHGYGQSDHALTALQFRQKINDLPTAPLLDVRTPDEFSKGHLPKAKNINWNDDSFMQQIATLDKNKPVLVYCLSGGRSGAAAQKMRDAGFKDVYELEGGIMKWRGAKLPEDGNKNMSAGMSPQQYEALLTGDKLVLVDFYAEWCGPCQKMAPYLKELSTEMADRVVIVRINADDNHALTQSLNIDALPKLILYDKQQIKWEHTGYISKNDVVKQLK